MAGHYAVAVGHGNRIAVRKKYRRNYFVKNELCRASPFFAIFRFCGAGSRKKAYNDAINTMLRKEIRASLRRLDQRR